MNDCYRCARRKSCRRVVWPSLKAAAPILIISDSPHDDSGDHFAGNSGSILKSALIRCGLDPESHVSTGYSVLCSTNKKPAEEELAECSSYLWVTIRRAIKSGAKVVVTCGAVASKAVLGSEIKLTQSNARLMYPKCSHEVWNSQELFFFLQERGISLPNGMDRIPYALLSDPEFIQGFVNPAISMGFSYENPPEIPVIPTYSPLYFTNERASQMHLLDTALNRAKSVASGVSSSSDGGGKEYFSFFEAEESIRYMDDVIALYEAGSIPYVAIDLETVGPEGEKVDGALKPFLPGGAVVTINLSHKVGFGVVIYLEHPETRMSVSQRAAVAKKYRELLEKVPIVGANLKFDLHWSRFKLGARKWTIAHDVQLMNYSIHLGQFENSLKSVTARLLPEDAGFEDGVRNFLDALPEEERHYDNIPSKLLTNYAAHDVDVVLRLVPILLKQLTDSGQLEVYRKFAMNPYPAFIAMEQAGAHINPSLVESLSEEFSAKVQSIYDWFESSPFYDEWVRRRSIEVAESRQKYKKESFRNKPIQKDEIAINFGSPQQVAELLFSIAGLKAWGELGKPVKKLMHLFPKGVPSTDESSLENILENLYSEGRREDPVAKIIEKLLSFRGDSKILSGYLQKAVSRCPVESKPDWWDTRETLSDSRFYEAELYTPYCQSASYNLTSTRTGRTSSSNPNIQQVNSSMKRLYTPRDLPSREELIEMGLIPELNIQRIIANFDVGQAELRMLAAACRDSILVSILNDPSRDIHREVAAVAFRKSPAEVTKDERTKAKTIVFGTLYGRSPQAIAVQLKTPVEEAVAIQRALFELMPDSERWIAEKHREAEATGKVVTPTGRVRDLSSYAQKGERDRRSVNTPIQSGASDLTMWATGKVYQQMQAENIKSTLWGFVHDSLNFDLFPQEAERLMVLCRYYFSEMTPREFPWYNVPLVFEFEFGLDWASQVPATYENDTRKITFSGSALKIAGIFDAFRPLLKDVQVDPEWHNKVSSLDSKGNSDPKDVWVSGIFL
jgi:uracil-DNA glycosylase family 4